MTAVFLAQRGLLDSSLTIYFTVALLLVSGFVVAPPRVRRDRRVVAALLVLIVAVVIGAPTHAAVTNICDYAWWAFECWFR